MTCSSSLASGLWHAHQHQRLNPCFFYLLRYLSLSCEVITYFRNGPNVYVCMQFVFSNAYRISWSISCPLYDQAKLISKYSQIYHISHLQSMFFKISLNNMLKNIDLFSCVPFFSHVNYIFCSICHYI